MMKKQEITHTSAQNTTFDLKELLAALCHRMLTQTRFCENGTGAGLPANERDLLQTLRPSADKAPYSLNGSDFSKRLSGKMPFPDSWIQNPNNTAQYLAYVTISTLLSNCLQEDNPQLLKKLASALDKYCTRAQAAGHSCPQGEAAIALLSHPDPTGKAFHARLVIPPDSGKDARSLSPAGRKLYETLYQLFDFALRQMKPKSPLSTSGQPRQLNSAEHAVCTILALAGGAGIPCRCLYRPFYAALPDIESRLHALVDRNIVLEVLCPAPYDPEATLPYYELKPAFQSEETLSELIANLRSSGKVQELLTSFFTHLTQNELLIEEDIANLNQDAGAWYQGLLEWLPFCQQILDRPWPSDQLAAILGRTYWTFLRSAVQVFYYMNDPLRAFQIFHLLPELPQTADTRTAWLQNQALRMNLLCAVGQDPHSCYAPVYRLSVSGQNLTKEEQHLLVSISCMYAWALIGSNTPNPKEINQILDRIRTQTPLALTGYERCRYSPQELLRLNGSPEGRLVVGISKSGEDFILDMVGLPKSGSIRALRPAQLASGNHFCCATMLPGFCDNAAITCEQCSHQNGRQICSSCPAGSECDFYQAYFEMQHIFFLYKRTWQNELPYEMVLKGLRRGVYRAYGIYREKELLSYIDVKETWENGKEIQTFGFAFTKKDFRSQKLTHALINHVRLLHPQAVFRMTTNQLNSSMLRCCRNLGFREYAQKDDRVFTSIKTCCEEAQPLL